ncbi:MAG: sulfurtransferase TusA family protein [Armatimonadetes bacterium]|nr:sulfurtransferase TusA family protein [Armatimonadota bacterium]
MDLDHLTPDRVFDGGDLDCGSGLALLIRENLLQVPEEGILELRSREPTVAADLPPWCRLVGHEFLGARPGPGYSRYFVRRSPRAPGAAGQLDADKEQADSYEWRTRARAAARQKSTVYCRNFSFNVGQPASFEEKDAHPSAVEYLLGALAASLASGFASEALRSGLDIDDVEVTARGRVQNALAVIGIGEGKPAFASVEIKAFVSTLEEEADARAAWDRAVLRNPLVNTLEKAVELHIRMVRS